MTSADVVQLGRLCSSWEKLDGWDIHFNAAVDRWSIVVCHPHSLRIEGPHGKLSVGYHCQLLFSREVLIDSLAIVYLDLQLLWTRLSYLRSDYSVEQVREMIEPYFRTHNDQLIVEVPKHSSFQFYRK